MEAHAERMFVVLEDCGLLAQLFPAEHFHFEQGLLANDQTRAFVGGLRFCAREARPVSQRFALLAGPMQPDADAALEALLQRLRAPNDCRDAARLFLRHGQRVAQVAQLDAQARLQVIEACDSFRRPERLLELIHVVQAWQAGRLGGWSQPLSHTLQPRMHSLQAARSVDAAGDRKAHSGAGCATDPATTACRALRCDRTDAGGRSAHHPGKPMPGSAMSSEPATLRNSLRLMWRGMASNLRGGARLALFMPVRLSDFRVSVGQFALVYLLGVLAWLLGGMAREGVSGGLNLPALGQSLAQLPLMLMVCFVVGLVHGRVPSDAGPGHADECAGLAARSDGQRHGAGVARGRDVAVVRRLVSDVFLLVGICGDRTCLAGLSPAGVAGAP
jgi:hypothetical protein